MKKDDIMDKYIKTLLLVIICAFSFTACNDSLQPNPIPTSPAEDLIPIGGGGIGDTSIIINPPPGGWGGEPPVGASKVSGPNLDPDWNWIQPQDCTVVLYTPNHPNGIPVTMPFYDSDYWRWNLVTAKNVEPSNGWRLYYRNFGVPETPENHPAFVLYNKYSGMFKVFVYVTHGISGKSNFLMTVKRIYNGTPSSKVYYATVKGVSKNDWYSFHFPAVYYNPDIGTQQAFFNYLLNGVVLTLANLHGSIQLNAIYSQAGSNLLSKAGDVLHQLGSQVAPAVKLFRGFAKDGALDYLREQFSKLGEGVLPVVGEVVPSAALLPKFIGFLIGGNSAPVLMGFKGTFHVSGHLKTKYILSSPPAIKIAGSQSIGTVLYPNNGPGMPSTPYNNDGTILDGTIGVFNKQIQNAKWEIVRAKQVPPCHIPGGRGRFNHKVCSTQYTVRLNSRAKIQINPIIKNSNVQIIKKASMGHSDFHRFNYWKTHDAFSFKCRGSLHNHRGNRCPRRTPIHVKIVIKKPSDPNFKMKVVMATSSKIRVDWSSLGRGRR